MNEFEKWKSKNCDKNSKLCSHAEASCNGCESMWRAALNWVLTHKADIINTKFIEKELQHEHN